MGCLRDTAVTSVSRTVWGRGRLTEDEAREVSRAQIMKDFLGHFTDEASGGFLSTGAEAAVQRIKIKELAGCWGVP